MSIIWEEKSLISEIDPHEDIWLKMPKLDLRCPRIKVRVTSGVLWVHNHY